MGESIQEVTNKCTNPATFCFGIKLIDGTDEEAKVERSYGFDAGCLKEKDCDAYVVAERINTTVEGYEETGEFKLVDSILPGGAELFPEYGAVSAEDDSGNAVIVEEIQSSDGVKVVVDDGTGGGTVVEKSSARYFETGPSDVIHNFYIVAKDDGSLSLVEFFLHEEALQKVESTNEVSNDTTLKEYASARLEFFQQTIWSNRGNLTDGANQITTIVLAYPTFNGKPDCANAMVPCFRLEGDPIKENGYAMGRFFRIQFEDKPLYAYLGIGRNGSSPKYFHTEHACKLFSDKEDCGVADPSQSADSSRSAAGLSLAFAVIFLIAHA